jgi:hypothetical protein
MTEVERLRKALGQLLAAVDGSPGAIATADAVSTARAALAALPESRDTPPRQTFEDAWREYGVNAPYENGVRHVARWFWDARGDAPALQKVREAWEWARETPHACGRKHVPYHPANACLFCDLIDKLNPIFDGAAVVAAGGAAGVTTAAQEQGTRGGK